MSQKASTYPLINDPQANISAANKRPLTDITIESVMAGDLSGDDLRISADTLQQQATIAEQAGYTQLAANLTRAAELVDIPNEELLRMYDALRPRRATFEILQALAATLEEKYHAPMNAKMVREAASVYRDRGLLRKD